MGPRPFLSVARDSPGAERSRATYHRSGGTDSRPRQYDAVLFDLDGVITATAHVHASAWKRMFDEYLEARADSLDEPFRPFTEDDYLNHIDGRPRYDGVRTFLTSRRIDLPEGKSSDSPDRETVCGLGNRKDELFNQVLESEGVEVYEGSVRFLKLGPGTGDEDGGRHLEQEPCGSCGQGRVGGDVRYQR